MVRKDERSIDDIVDFRVGSVEHRGREWLRKNSLGIAHRVYLDLFRNIAMGQGLSERYANSLEIKLKNKYSQSGKLKLNFIVNYFDEDTGEIPLWKFFEFGTRRHFIEPKNTKALRWQTGTTSSVTGAGSPIYAFSKGHFVSGIKPRKVLYWTLKRGHKRFGNQLVKGLKKFLKDNATEIGV